MLHMLMHQILRLIRFKYQRIGRIVNSLFFPFINETTNQLPSLDIIRKREGAIAPLSKLHTCLLVSYTYALRPSSIMDSVFSGYQSA